MAGQKVRCAQCGQKISLPRASAPAAGVETPQDVRPLRPDRPDPHSQLAGSVIPTAWGTAPAAQDNSAQYTCTACGARFDVSDVYDLDGSVICKGCFSAR